MSIDPKSLKLFLRVIEAGTIAAAAEREHIAAAAVSRRISELEASLGTELVLRSNKGLTPTPAGQALLGLSHRVLSDLDEIHALMRDYAKGLTGYVRVFANISAITQFMPSALSTFLKAHPSIQVHLEEKTSTAIAQAVLDNVADIGILVKGAPIPGLELHPYREDELVVVVPKGHVLARRARVSFEETLEFDYVGLNPKSQLNLQLTQAASERGRPWTPRIQVTSYDALCLMIEAGLGIGVLPRHIAMSHAKALRIKVLALSEPWAHRVLALCIRSYHGLSPAAQLLVDHMLNESRHAGGGIP